LLVVFGGTGLGQTTRPSLNSAASTGHPQLLGAQEIEKLIVARSRYQGAKSPAPMPLRIPNGTGLTATTIPVPGLNPHRIRFAQAAAVPNRGNDCELAAESPDSSLKRVDPSKLNRLK
jgi:hypothetical protein